jgi:hypothetical protein
MVILYNNTEFNDGDTVALSGGAALDIWNKYSRKNLRWHIRAYPQPSWITFETTDGTITGGGRKSAVFSLDKSKMTNYGVNYSDVILTTEDNGSFSVKVKSFKEDNNPMQAVITGEHENICPAKSVMLTANSIRAQYYKWFMGTTLLSGANANTYEAKYNGTYHAMGVNAEGDGVKSSGHTVSIKTCPDRPAKAGITSVPYGGVNDCNEENGQSIKLTANADRATSYTWRKGTQQLNETGNTLLASEIGTHTYYVKGVNESGPGEESAGKTIIVNSCAPDNPTNLSVSMSGNSFNVFFSGVNLATSYKIQCCNTPNCDDSVYTKVENSAWQSYYFNESVSFCDKNYFRVIAVNHYGESSGVTTSRDRTISLSNPSLYASSDGAISWSSASVSGVTATVYYDLYRKIGNGLWEIIVQHTTNRSYNDSYYSDDEYIYFKVRAYINACGRSLESNSNIDYY